jgi:hypothetical protein
MVAQLCNREKCSVRQVNMTILLAFLAPNLVKAAVEGRLPRGIGIERLRDPLAKWSRQFVALGLIPKQRPSQRSRITAAQKPGIRLHPRSDFTVAGNGIFGCRDEAPEIVIQPRERLQRPKSGK